MKLLKHTDWRSLPLELLIVFIGLLAALQVDEWREERQYREAETRYLERLAGDLDASVLRLTDLLEFMESNYRGVRHVHESLVAGEILDGDSRLFETGLIYVGHLPSLTMHSSAYDEMVASGMFARLQPESLKSKVAELYATRATVDANFSWWRLHPLELSRDLDETVVFYSEGARATTNPLLLDEPVRRARFDFEALRADISLRNRFYWAEDTHSDWVHWTRELLRIAGEARHEVEAALANRR